MSRIRGFIDRFEEEPVSPQQRARRRKKHLSPLEVAMDDATRRAESGEWMSAHGSTFVGLYALCHRMIYGVLPEELSQLGSFRAAARHAARCLHASFADNPQELAVFVRWTWEREKRRCAWARERSIERSRFGWRAQFSLAVVTDYNVDRKSKR